MCGEATRANVSGEVVPIEALRDHRALTDAYRLTEPAQTLAYETTRALYKEVFGEEWDAANKELPKCLCRIEDVPLWAKWRLSEAWNGF